MENKSINIISVNLWLVISKSNKQYILGLVVHINPNELL